MAAWFDTQDYVKRYAPFGVMKNQQGVNQDNALMNPDGSKTALGEWVSALFSLVIEFLFHPLLSACRSFFHFLISEFIDIQRREAS